MNWFKPSGPCSCDCIQPPCTCPGTKRYLVLENTEANTLPLGVSEIIWTSDGNIPPNYRYWKFSANHITSMTIELPEIGCAYNGIVNYSFPGAKAEVSAPTPPDVSVISDSDEIVGSVDIPGGGVLLQELQADLTTVIASYQYDLRLRVFWDALGGDYVGRCIFLDWAGSISGGISVDPVWADYLNPDPDPFGGRINWTTSQIGVRGVDTLFDQCGPTEIIQGSYFDLNGPAIGFTPISEVWRVYKWSIFQQ